MGNKGNRYSDEFKSMILKLYQTGKPVAEIISEYGLSKTALHKWVNNNKEIKVEDEVLTALDIRKLKAEIKDLKEENDGIYGAPKIRIELLKINLSFKVSERRVANIMRSLGIRSVVIKKFRPCRSDAVYNGGENLLNRDFSTTYINQKWVSDITYIHVLADGWCYLASVMDLATNKIIGWHFSRNMDTSLVLKALNNAVFTRGSLPEELIIHSDRGSQYTSHEYRNKIKELNIRQSFSAKGCPYDNAPIESFHAILKKELVYRRIFQDFEQAQMELFKYIESRYNRSRTHSGLNYLTPQQAEDNFKKVA